MIKIPVIVRGFLTEASMKARIVAVVAVANLLIATVPGFAHHADVAYEKKAILLKNAAIVSYAWKNPHGIVVCDVKDDAGKVTRWTLETGSPSAMLAVGWTRNSLVPGAVVTIDANPAKNGTSFGRLLNVTLADGTVLKYQAVQ